MSKVHEVQWRLLWERLRTLFRQAQRLPARRPPDGALADGALPGGNAELAELLLRLAGAAMMLLEWHTTDAEGHCRVRGCSRRSMLPWRARRTCRVFITVQFWMEQSLDIVEKTAREW